MLILGTATAINGYRQAQILSSEKTNKLLEQVSD